VIRCPVNPRENNAVKRTLLGTPEYSRAPFGGKDSHDTDNPADFSYTVARFQVGIAVMRLFPRLCLTFVLAVAWLSPAWAAQRVALVVGNSDYELISPLANPANDAALIAATLREVGFEVIEVKNADRRGMARAIRDFGKRLRRAGPEAVGLFYYAGHGVQAAGTNYLIPLGAPVETEADLEIEAVSAAWVLGQMEYAGNALNVVILDACRNNPFKSSFRAATRGLARMNAPSGSLVAYAAAPGQVAADGITNNSPYTAALAAAMREPGLPLEQIFKRVRIAVEAATGQQQTPWEESSLKGDFYFVPQGSTVTVTPPGALQPQPAFDVRAVELALWETVKDSDKVVAYEAYLAQFPNGTFAVPARLKIEELKEQETGKSEARNLELAFWNSIKDSTNEADFDAYLRTYPAGKFARLAKAKSAQMALSSPSSEDEVVIQTPSSELDDLEIDGRWAGEIIWKNMNNGTIYETCSITMDVKSLKFSQWHTCRKTWKFSGAIESDGNLSKGVLWRGTAFYSLSGHIWSSEGPAKQNSSIRAFVKLQKKN